MMEVVREVITRPYCECCLKTVDAIVKIPRDSLLGRERTTIPFCASCLLGALKALEEDKLKRAPTGMLPTR